MLQDYFVEVPVGLNRKIRFRVLLLLLLAIVSATKSNAQSLGFAPAHSRGKYTVSVRELKASEKAKDNFEHGWRELLKNDPKRSLWYFAAAIAEAPDFYEAYYHQGVAEMQLDQNQQALRSFQAAIDLSDGRYPRAEFGYALVLSRVGSATEAERIVRHGLQTDANNPDGHVVLGLVLLKLNRLDEAERSAQQALLLRQPGSAKGHLILADVQGARGDFEGQADELEAYLKQFPNDRKRKFLETTRDVARKLAAKKVTAR
jgi:tetratricopeptide (TPR) repeat protein